MEINGLRVGESKGAMMRFLLFEAFKLIMFALVLGLVVLTGSTALGVIQSSVLIVLTFALMFTSLTVTSELTVFFDLTGLTEHYKSKILLADKLITLLLLIAISGGTTNVLSLTIFCLILLSASFVVAFTRQVLMLKKGYMYGGSIGGCVGITPFTHHAQLRPHGGLSYGWTEEHTEVKLEDNQEKDEVE